MNNESLKQRIISLLKDRNLNVDTVRKAGFKLYISHYRYVGVDDHENGFTSNVGRDVWQQLEHEMLDRTAGLRYCDALKPL